MQRKIRKAVIAGLKHKGLIKQNAKRQDDGYVAEPLAEEGGVAVVPILL